MHRILMEGHRIMGWPAAYELCDGTPVSAVGPQIFSNFVKIQS